MCDKCVSVGVKKFFAKCLCGCGYNTWVCKVYVCGTCVCVKFVCVCNAKYKRITTVPQLTTKHIKQNQIKFGNYELQLMISEMWREEEGNVVRTI